MKILALEASRAPIGIAALESANGQAQIAAMVTMDDARTLCENLIALLDAALVEARWELADVEALAIGLGPGSWTGLRIALSTWKTLAQSREIPLLGVPSFDALAQAAWRNQDAAQRLVLVAAPCRPGEIYGKIFASHGESLLTVQDEWIAQPAQMLDALWTQSLSRDPEVSPLVVVAQGHEELGQTLGALFEQSGEAPELVSIDIAAATIAVAVSALARWQAGEADDALSLQPLYIAASAAERNRTAAKVA